MEFSNTDVLCERHFRESDIIREDEVILKNGVKFKSRRDILKLARNTIPIKVPRNDVAINRIEIDPADHEMTPENSKESNTENSEASPERDSKNVTIKREIANDVILNALEESIENTEIEFISVPDIISSNEDEKLSSDHETITDTSEPEGLKSMKEKLPPEWHVNKYSDTIELSHINPQTFEIKKRIKILPNMTMEVIY